MGVLIKHKTKVNMKRITQAGVVIFSTLALAGCSSVRQEAAFHDVQRMVEARTGQNLEWIHDPAANEKVEQTVQSLLAKDLTVEAAVQIALFNNRSLQATFEEIGISQADLVQAGLLKNPQIAASIRFPDRPPSAADTEYSITDDILNLIIQPLHKKMAIQQLEQTKLRVANEVLKLVADVKGAFYTVQAGQQLLGRLRVIGDANQAAAELAKNQHEAGTVNELDLVNQQAIYNQTRLELLQAEAQAQLNREKLNRLLGISGTDAPWKVAAQLPEVPREKFPSEQLESLALSQRLDLAVTSNQVAVLEDALSLRKNTRFLPTQVNVGFDAERQSDREWIRGPTLELDLPIFDQGQGEMGRLQSQLRQTQRLQEALIVQIRSETREANALVNADREAAELYNRILIPERSQIIDLTLQHYNFMLKGTYDLLLAKQQEAQTERAYIEVWRDYWIARSELERAVGGKLPQPTVEHQP